MRKQVYFKLSAFFFFFFVSWSACYSLFAIWLGQEIHLNGAATGLIFGINAGFTLVMQPLYGFISDKLGIRKNLLVWLSGILIFTGPFFIYVYGPLLKYNVLLGSVVGGLFLGIGYLASCGAIESYVEKISRKYDFEYGRARMWGSLGWAAATFFAGQLFNINPNYNFWIASVAAIVMFLIMLSLKVEVSEVEVKKAQSVKVADVFNLFKMKDFWFFIIFVLGVTCVYGVYDQQFPRYFAEQFNTVKEGNLMFGYLNSFQVFLEAGMMFLAPKIVNKLGARNSLLLAGFLMAFRITGSGIVNGPILISIMKLIHSIELPILLVSVFKYLDANFESRLSSILYLVGYQFSGQIGTIVLSSLVGHLYDQMGFKTTYLYLGIFVFVFAMIAVFTLKKSNEQSIDTAQVNHA
ncbi:MFS transporter [Companilactobacillus nodensis]|uniref:LacY protein n=1 Tax=Companilactobacillus nodensis DSM 19682 = JCM 14932 = NBRC 107160 TaxID=1423775 RepID=A0A0R1KNT3_9LACO|nr:MFS transporter [Companilactobacillus nodensis]KRK80983.1 lacY protein [Companilactobacillus nodensis DSM 19682 = JCM 14932 = NBRC 107160]